MKPNFSFNYADKLITADSSHSKTPDGMVYELDKNVTATLIVKEYKEFDATEWIMYFENASDADSLIFSDIKDCHTTLPFEPFPPLRPGNLRKEGELCVITMKGMVSPTYYKENDQISATEFSFMNEYLTQGKPKSFCCLGARSSNGMMPFFDITANNSGYITAIGWTGDWNAEFISNEEGVEIKTGLKQTHFYLKPGEKIRTSSTLVMKYTDKEDKHNKFRKLMKTHVSHKSHTKAERDGVMAYIFWGGLKSEEMKKRINEAKQHGLQFEDLWIDAGWYGDCTKCDEAFTGDWYEHTGEWHVNKRVHPEELRDVSECANDAGMKLMLWFEPERAIKDTIVPKEHPDWFITRSNDDSYILNYGNEKALEYVCNLLSDYVEKLNMSCYRQDFNTDLSNYFEITDDDNRKGITEIKHIMGMYKVWDYILEKHPGLIIDNCASGGRRIDIETLKRSIPVLKSDYLCYFNKNPEVLQTHNSNASKYLPYIGCTNKFKNDVYGIRSSYSSSIGCAFYSAIFQNMTEEDFAWAKKYSDEYRRIRKYFIQDFYNHATDTFDETAWTVWQYHDSETQSGIVMAFRRCKSPYDQLTVELKGMDNATYSYTNLNDESVFTGDNKLKIVLPEKRSSIIYEYKNV